MYRGNQLASAVHNVLHGLQVFPASDLIHGYHPRRHGADQHHHASGLRTAVEDIGADSQLILGHSLVAGADFRPFVHHSHRHTWVILCPVGNLPDQITEQRRLPAPRRRNDQGMQNFFLVIEIRKNRGSASLHLM